MLTPSFTMESAMRTWSTRTQERQIKSPSFIELE